MVCCGGVWGVVWCAVVCCGVMWVWCCVVWVSCAVLCCGVLCCAVVWCGVVWCGVLCCAAVWCGVERQSSGVTKCCPSLVIESGMMYVNDLIDFMDDYLYVCTWYVHSVIHYGILTSCYAHASYHFSWYQSNYLYSNAVHIWSLHIASGNSSSSKRNIGDLFILFSFPVQ